MILFPLPCSTATHLSARSNFTKIYFYRGGGDVMVIKCVEHFPIILELPFCGLNPEYLRFPETLAKISRSRTYLLDPSDVFSITPVSSQSL